MQASAIQRQYDQIIASHYDSDPRSVIGDSLDQAVAQIETAVGNRPGLRVLDLGIGTGRFLEKLRTSAGLRIEPYGLDISQKMIDIARTRIPDLVSAVDDAANLKAHFPGVAFDLIGTHFLTGFIPIRDLAPKIARRLAKGGMWSFVGGTREGFPVLQKKANVLFLRWLFGMKRLDVGDIVCNPADQAEVVATLEDAGFAVQACQTFSPRLVFKDVKDFLEFGYYGGWLTPFVETLGLDRAGPLLRLVLNGCVFPVEDRHSIVIALAERN
jgi:ubiquinone/menaquinone biosynthesis C-methylase UbiE